jgi:hypothetical protein
MERKKLFTAFLLLYIAGLCLLFSLARKHEIALYIVAAQVLTSLIWGAAMRFVPMADFGRYEVWRGWKAAAFSVLILAMIVAALATAPLSFQLCLEAAPVGIVFGTLVFWAFRELR